MKVYNVGYGSYLIEKDGKIYMFDVGLQRVGRNLVVPFIYRNFPNVTRIEKVFFSHWHNNHTGGFIELAKNFEIGHLYSNGTYSSGEGNGYYNDPDFEKEIKEIVEEKNIPYSYLKQGDMLQENGLEFTVWAPLEQHFTGGGLTDDPNGASGMILNLAYGDFSILFGGDIWDPQKLSEIWDVIGDVEITVFAWPHHGDPHTTVDSVIDPLNMKLAMIESLGTSNQTIDYLKNKGIEYVTLNETLYTGIEVSSDGSFEIIAGDTKKYNKPKGKTFMF